MADIVQLKENGVFKYLKTHFKAVEGLVDELLKKQDKINATDPVTAVTSGVTHDSGKPLEYWKEGYWVHFEGGGTFPTAAGTTFLILPAGFAPKRKTKYFTATVRDSDTTRKCIVQVLTNGECKILTNSYSGNPVFLDGFSFKTDTAA